MLYPYLRLDEIENPKLKRLVKQARTYHENYRQYNKELSIIYTKTLPLALEIRDWRLYFDVLYDILYSSMEEDAVKRVVQYAEVFYKACDEYLEEALAQFPYDDIGLDVVISYYTIFYTYSECYQLNDEKMTEFMRRFHDAAQRFDEMPYYWEICLKATFLYGDAQEGRKCFETFKRYPVKYGCYICNKKPEQAYYILADEPEQAEEITKRILSRSIPKDKQWCYNYCTDGDAASQYEYITFMSVRFGKKDAFAYFLPKAFEAIIHDEQKEESARRALVRAAAGNFSCLKAELAAAREDIEKRMGYTTFQAALDMLSWWVYFQKLAESGKMQIEFSINEEGFPAADSAGQRDVQKIADWFESAADGYGRQFEKSRAKFHYDRLKENYRVCCGL